MKLDFLKPNLTNIIGTIILYIIYFVVGVPVIGGGANLVEHVIIPIIILYLIIATLIYLLVRKK